MQSLTLVSPVGPVHFVQVQQDFSPLPLKSQGEAQPQLYPVITIYFFFYKSEI